MKWFNRPKVPHAKSGGDDASRVPERFEIMTYDEISRALNIGAKSARNLVRRKRWGRKIGADGAARVSVPISELKLISSRPNRRVVLQRVDLGGDDRVSLTVSARAHQHVDVAAETLAPNWRRTLAGMFARASKWVSPASEATS